MTNIIFIISIIFYILFIFIFSIYYFKKSFEVIRLTEKITTLKSSYNNLSESFDSIREFKHDFSNILQSMNGYIFTENYNGLKKYYSSLLKDYNISNNPNSIKNCIINNPAIHSLILEKSKKAENFGINFNIEIYFDFDTLKIDTYEFSRILGIFLDNSIEAAKNSEDKTINIVIKKDVYNYRDLILIENTYSDKKIDIKKIFEKNYSSKLKNTGIGLFKVKKILKKYKNVILKTTTNEKYFTQKLEIY
ncbi:MAG: GHKL domain-containing protein [Clostridia bacterium]|nr:GHKL domain-containing protein [Clostridia bacterium]